FHFGDVDDAHAVLVRSWRAAHGCGGAGRAHGGAVRGRGCRAQRLFCKPHIPSRLGRCCAARRRRFIRFSKDVAMNDTIAIPLTDAEKSPIRRIAPTWPARDMPRERLLDAGPAALSDTELVALVLGSGLPGHNVFDVARSLLQRFG